MAFGEIPGQAAGAMYRSYAEMITAGIHRQYNVGMVGGAKNGTESIVLNGGYRDDLDVGSEVVYTGFGGQDGSGRQISDQQWIRANEGLRVNMVRGVPVRVIRGSNGDPAHSPLAGYRYDGLYAVDDAWQEPSADGPLICRFRLVKSDEFEIPVDPTLPSPTPPARVSVTVIRVIRDTSVALRVKELYDFTCQVCGLRLVVPGGLAYAEGAHIRPLGLPFRGLDVVENILCLCPTDHVRFDRGAIYFDTALNVIDGLLSRVVGRLTVHASHRIDLVQVAAHRNRFGY